MVSLALPLASPHLSTPFPSSRPDPVARSQGLGVTCLLAEESHHREGHLALKSNHKGPIV